MLVLRTSAEIKRALDSMLPLILAYDQRTNLRRETARYRRKLLTTNAKCAICGHPKQDSVSLEAAHIHGLYEGGTTTLQNVILLCRRSPSQVGPTTKSAKHIGCHSLFDNHLCASPNEIREARNCWSQGTVPSGLRAQIEARFEKMSQQPMSFSDKRRYDYLELISKRYWAQAEKSIKSEIKKSDSEDDRFYHLLNLAVVERRRPALKGRKRAHELLFKLQTQVPKQYASWFYYELGYLHRLCGRHSQAIDTFEQSERTGSSLKDKFVARWNVLECMVSLTDTKSITKDRAKAYLKRAAGLLDVTRRRSGDVHLGRWHTVGLLNIVRLNNAFGDYRRAYEAWDDFLKDWDGRHFLSGRVRAHETTVMGAKTDLDSRPTLFQRYGLLGAPLRHESNPRPSDWSARVSYRY